MEQHIPSPRIRRTRRQIRDLLAEFSQADCTVKEFCSAHHIKPATFHKWQARFKNARRPAGKAIAKKNRRGFSELQVVSSLPHALFAEVSGIRIYQPVTAAYLKELLA